jgi:hypothetical protein
MLANGTPPTIVRDVLRHSSLAITLRYWRSTSEDQRRALDAQSKRLAIEPVAPAAAT